METRDLILIEQFCMHHDIDFSFIISLHEFGLIEIVELNDTKYLANEQLKDIEKMMRLHYELDINLEGIDAISNLLKQIDSLQRELIATRNKLKVFDID